MTKQVGVLTPPGGGIVKECGNCTKIRRQAEDAFSELRTQTDRHIHAVQKKLRDDHSVEIGKLTAKIESVEKELANAVSKPSKSDIKKITDDFQKKISETKTEYEQRISVLQAKLDEAESRLAKTHEDTLRSARRDHLLRDARVSELVSENQQLSEEVDKLEVELQSARSKVERAKLDQDVQIERQTRALVCERDEAKERLALSEERLGSLESFKRESEIEKAKIDLNYRRRLGEMESEIRRTEIESVRLRREIIQLTQRLEIAEQTTSNKSSSSFPMLMSARSRLFALESDSAASKLPPSTKGGMIAKINDLRCTSPPKRSPRAVQELPPPTPSMSRSSDADV